MRLLQELKMLVEMPMDPTSATFRAVTNTLIELTEKLNVELEGKSREEQDYIVRQLHFTLNFLKAKLQGSLNRNEKLENQVRNVIALCCTNAQILLTGMDLYLDHTADDLRTDLVAANFQTTIDEFSELERQFSQSRNYSPRLSGHENIVQDSDVADPNHVLLMIGVQTSFILSNGGLPVPQGEEILPEINQLAGRFQHRVQMMDAHLPNAHFHSDVCGCESFTEISKDEGTAFPPHAIIGSADAGLHPTLKVEWIDIAYPVGTQQRHSVSIGADLDGTVPVNAAGKAFVDQFPVNEYPDVTVVGLATDFLVQATVLYLREKEYDVTLINSAVRGVIPPLVEESMRKMQAAGVTVVENSHEFITNHCRTARTSPAY